MDRNLQILGLARKAGLLAIGADDTNSAARAGKTRVVISASDASGSALRRAQGSAAIGSALHIVAPYTSFELGGMTGRGSPGTLAILDTGLAAGFLRGLAEAAPDRYGKSAELLTNMAQTGNDRKIKARPVKRRSVQ